MAKTLPILGIVASVMAVLAGLVFVSIAEIIPPLFVIVAAIFFLRERNPMATAFAVVAILVALVALGGALGSFSYKESSLGFGVSEDVGRVLSIVACLVLAVAVAMLRRIDIEPAWIGMAGIGAAVLAVILAIVFVKTLTVQTAPMTLVFAVVALLAMVPSVVALRNDDGLPA